jgi:hypothetical protein
MEFFHLYGYWAVAAIAACSIINVYVLINLWREHRKENVLNYHPPEVRFLRFAKTVGLSAILIGCLGMFALGYSPVAATDPVRLHNAEATAPSQEALETERRAADEIVTRTRKELEHLRYENERLKAELADKQYKAEIKSGQDQMLETRKRLLERNN